jgi:hypothetical protein
MNRLQINLIARYMQMVYKKIKGITLFGKQSLVGSFDVRPT